MKEVYVHTLRYHFHGRGNRKSRIMFPLSYGPFKDEDAAREWIRQSGMTSATRLMSNPAAENVKVLDHNPFTTKNDKQTILGDTSSQQAAAL